ncbi:MAG: hypothetical protein QG608_3 [Actinomycetota bacterium]|nr:hypothetical protein [Actinomycetota bacterium]
MTTSVMNLLRQARTTTVLSVNASVRLVVVPDRLGGHLVPEVVVHLTSLPRRVAILGRHRVALETIQAPAWYQEGSLRREFDIVHPHMSALLTDLTSRSEQYLAGLRMGERLDEVEAFGRALSVIHRELAAADRMRRGWIARRGYEVRGCAFDLAPDDLLSLEHCPAALASDTRLPKGVAPKLSEGYGLLFVVSGSNSEEGAGEPTTLHMYRRSPHSLPEIPEVGVGRMWQRDDILGGIPLIDEADGASFPSGNLPDPDDQVRDVQWSETIAVARCQLELLEASDEYVKLAVSHERIEEVAALREEVGLLAGPRPRR